MENSNGYQLVLTTCPGPDSARELAEALINMGVAACVSQIPGVLSTYRWKDKLEHDEEVLLLIKSRSEGYAKLESTILSRHPYELPEIIAIPIEQGHAAYLDWIDRQLEQTQ